MSLLAPTLQAFFTERLITQRDASEQTIASYRDAMRLLIAFASQQTGKQPCQLEIEDLNAPLIGAFFEHVAARSRQQFPHPQPAAGGDPLAVPLRITQTPRARGDDHAGGRDPCQAIRAQRHPVSERRGGQGATRRA